MTIARQSEKDAIKQFNNIRKTLITNMVVKRDVKRPAGGWVFYMFVKDRANTGEWVRVGTPTEVKTPAQLAKLVSPDFSSAMLWLTHSAVTHNETPVECSFDITSLIRNTLARQADRKVTLYS